VNIPILIEFWQWWIAAIVLLVIESFLPGQIFLWMGLSAGVIGLVLLIFADLGWMVARLSTKYGIASDPG
jgi:hypothetical protein